MSQQPIGVAVIGAGMAGRAHCAGYRSAPTLFDPPLPPIHYAAVIDANEATAGDAAVRYGYERHGTDWRALLTADDVQVVSVVVANALHREIVEALLAAGKHVICEKPLSDSLDDAQAMADAALGHAELVTGTAFVYRRQPAVAAIRELVQDELGEVSHFNGRYWCDYARSAQTPMAWRYKGGPGTGALADIGSHLIDLAEFVCGPMTQVGGAAFTTKVKERYLASGTTYGHARAELTDVKEPVENDDVATFTAHFASGAVGTFSISRVAPGHANSLAFDVFAGGGAATVGHGPAGRVLGSPADARRRPRRLQPGARRSGAPLPQGRGADGLPRRVVRRGRPVRLPAAGVPRAGRRHRGRPAPGRELADGVRDLTIIDAVIRSAAAVAPSSTCPRTTPPEPRHP